MIGEIIRGEVHVSPRPAPKHAFSGAQVGADILGAFGRRRGPGPGGWIMDVHPIALDDGVRQLSILRFLSGEPISR